MRSEALRVVLASWPDEDELVAEIWSGEDYLGDVRRRDGGFVASLRPTSGSSPLLRLEDLETAFSLARARLEGESP